MSKKCVCCSSSEMPLYARVAISPDGIQYQVPFCRNCYEAVKNMNRVHTAELGVVDLLPVDAPVPQATSPQPAVENSCDRCGRYAETYFPRVYVDAQGQQFQANMCPDCYEKCKDTEWTTLAGRGTVKMVSEYSSDDRYEIHIDKPSIGWEIFLKFICIILVIAATIAGGIIGAAEGEFIGLLIGGGAGFLGSMVTIALVMVICEISITLKEVLFELKMKD